MIVLSLAWPSANSVIARCLRSRNLRPRSGGFSLRISALHFSFAHFSVGCRSDHTQSIESLVSSCDKQSASHSSALWGPAWFIPHRAGYKNPLAFFGLTNQAGHSGCGPSRWASPMPKIQPCRCTHGKTIHFAKPGTKLLPKCRFPNCKCRGYRPKG